MLPTQRIDNNLFVFHSILVVNPKHPTRKRSIWSANGIILLLANFGRINSFQRKSFRILLLFFFPEKRRKKWSKGIIPPTDPYQMISAHFTSERANRLEIPSKWNGKSFPIIQLPRIRKRLAPTAAAMRRCSFHPQDFHFTRTSTTALEPWRSSSFAALSLSLTIIKTDFAWMKKHHLSKWQTNGMPITRSAYTISYRDPPQLMRLLWNWRRRKTEQKSIRRKKNKFGTPLGHHLSCLVLSVSDCLAVYLFP